MRLIVNFVITFVVLLVSCKLTPDYVLCNEGWEFIFVVTIIYWFIKSVLTIPADLITLWLCYMGEKEENFNKIIVGEVFSAISSLGIIYVALSACSCFIVDFTILNNFAYILLVFILHTVQFKAKVKKKR